MRQSLRAYLDELLAAVWADCAALSVELRLPPGVWVRYAAEVWAAQTRATAQECAELARRGGIRPTLN